MPDRNYSCAKIFVEKRNMKVINTSKPTRPYVNDSDPVRATRVKSIQPINKTTRYPTNRFSNLFISDFFVGEI
jgi:hypothetical protein